MPCRHHLMYTLNCLKDLEGACLLALFNYGKFCTGTKYGHSVGVYWQCGHTESVPGRIQAGPSESACEAPDSYTVGQHARTTAQALKTTEDILVFGGSRWRQDLSCWPAWFCSTESTVTARKYSGRKNLVALFYDFLLVPKKVDIGHFILAWPIHCIHPVVTESRKIQTRKKCLVWSWPKWLFSLLPVCL